MAKDHKQGDQGRDGGGRSTEYLVTTADGTRRRVVAGRMKVTDAAVIFRGDGGEPVAIFGLTQLVSVVHADQADAGAVSPPEPAPSAPAKRAGRTSAAKKRSAKKRSTKKGSTRKRSAKKASSRRASAQKS